MKKLNFYGGQNTLFFTNIMKTMYFYSNNKSISLKNVYFPMISVFSLKILIFLWL